MADDVNPGPPPPQGPVPPPVQPGAPPAQQPADWSQPPQPGYGYQPQETVLDSIIPTSNPPSLISYYCGVFSLTVCFSPILAPISYVYASRALKAIQANPQLKGRGHAITGIVTSSIGLAIFVLGLALILLSSRQP